MYDSMNGRYPECVSRLKKWLSSKVTDVSWTVSYAADVIKVLCILFTCTESKALLQNLPKQSNGSDCGVFVCMVRFHHSTLSNNNTVDLSLIQYALHELLKTEKYLFKPVRFIIINQ